MTVAANRDWTYLKPLRGEGVPRNLIFLDTETWPTQEQAKTETTRHVFRLAVAKYGRWEGGKLTRQDTEQFKDTASLWAWARRKMSTRVTTWLFAHNLGFDLTVSHFWDLVEQGYVDLGGLRKGGPQYGNVRVITKSRVKPYCILSDPPTIIHGHFDYAPFYAVDSYNYFRAPLSDMAVSVGLKKWELPAMAASETEWFRYCENDVAILQAMICRLIEWWETGKYGPWGPTAASLAWNAFRRKFLPEREILCHGDGEVLGLERHAYFGGQVATYFLGTVGDVADKAEDGHLIDTDGRPALPGPVHVLDVTSMYPYVMGHFPLPGRFHAKGGSLSRGEAEKIMGERALIARVQINSLDDDFPVHVDPNSGLPLLTLDRRCRDSSPYAVMRTVHARGRFTTVLCGPELMRALWDDCVDKIECWASYDWTACVAGYVDAFWGERQIAQGCGDKAWESFCKLMLNSLAGKFGQRRGAWEDDRNTPAPVPWGQWVLHDHDKGASQVLRSVGWHTQRQGERIETDTSTPAIAAYITSYGRELMRSYRNIAGARQVLYQDTDSLHVTQLGYRRLMREGFVEPSTLGLLRHCYTAARAHYCGAKHYSLDGVWTIGGIRTSARSVGEGAWKQDYWQRLPDVIAKRPDGGIRVESRQVILNPLHPLGELQADGYCYPTAF